MKTWNRLAIVLIFFVTLALICCSPKKEKAETSKAEFAQSSNYEDLVSLFKEWREFQKPKITEGVPDYTAAALKEQRNGLEKLKSRLAAMDCSAWPISQQVDFHLVRAEMNGLEFDHRVIRPWSRDPCFYAVVAKGKADLFNEGPDEYGLLRIIKMPLDKKDVADFQTKLRAIPKILEQAKGNLVEEAKDLWFMGIRLKKKESGILADLLKPLVQHHPDLVADAEQAKTSVDEFTGWLEKKQKTMTASSGIGIENYNWYMKNVHLVPYTWEEQVVIVQRDLERALACLTLEENRNRKLPELGPVGSDEEHRRRFFKAADYIMEFYREEEIFSVDEDMHVGLDIGPFVPLTSVRDFFTEIEYRDSLPMRCHGTHTLDDIREEHDQRARPIRGLPPLLYNLWAFRGEGLACGNEEMMMHLGLFDRSSPRVRELIYILLAHRAARAMADLKLHGNKFALEDAVNYAVDLTPRGWLPNEDGTWREMQFYLQQPGYGASYVVGKVQIDKLLADWSHQQGGKFILKQFMDEFYAAGMIPVSLTRWEMTGLEDEINKLR
jgi:hypothetical protein